MAVALAAVVGAVVAAPRSEAKPASAASVSLVVSPSGTGDDCSNEVPCSLWTGQAEARRLAGRVPVRVLLSDGTYSLPQPLKLTAADSGSPLDPVSYQAAPGAHPVLSGGIPVAGWTPVAGSGDLWSAPVPAGTASRLLFVDGQRLPRVSASPPGAWVQTSTGYFTTDSAAASWRNPADVELVFSEGNGFWTVPRCDVASITAVTGGADVTVRQPCWSNLHIPDQPADVTDPPHANGDNAMGGFEGLSSANPPSSIENAFELMSTAGQWYLDQPAHTVYYMAHPGEPVGSESFVMPVAESLVSVAGTPADPVHDITLSGLTFAYTTWGQPSSDEGFAEMQANFTLTGPNASGSLAGSTAPPEGTCQYTVPAGTCPFAAWTQEPAAVTLTGAHSVRIADDVFTHLGAAGLDIVHGSQGDLVQGNVVTDTSGSGIQLGSADDAQPIGGDPREIVRGNTIADNWIHDIAAEYQGGVGIWVGYTQGTTISHNQIDDTPYTAISFGWGGWHTDTLHPDNPSISGGNAITDNLIYNYLETIPDGGAIYTNGTQGPADPAGPAADPFLTTSTSPEQMARGLTITGNVALLATWSEFAYYNDEGGDYITWADDVEYQAHAFATGGCDTVGHIVFRDDYFAQPVGGYICPPPPVDITITNHHILPDHPGPGDIPDALLGAAGLKPAYRSLVTSGPPVVTGIGPQAGPTPSYPRVLVSGSGFTASTEVYFGPPSAATRSPDVTVLSANYLEAAPPPGAAGQVDVILRTPAGTSATSSGDQYLAVP
ncbi:MAG TPA: right-handed parallel beta-helix repeat-containing protein [Acidimicrobiales bacterium]|nr:right-handed parallel beta-helix repeat-containing protein [Acidimicrobiales bacterium]